MASIVEYQKTWISVNPVMGCSYGCAYCVLANRDFESMPTVHRSAEEALDALMAYEWFTPAVSPVAFNNYSEPFAKLSRPLTLEMLKESRHRKLPNTVALITKAEIQESDVAILSEVSEFPLLVFVSYSGLPESVEPIPAVWRIKTLQRLCGAGIPVFHYWRPLIRGLNTDQDTLKRMFDVVSRYARGSVLSGLKLTPLIEKALGSRGVAIPNEQWDVDHKVISSQVIDDIYSLRDRLYPSYPLFLRTSCAASYILGVSDFNGNWHSPERVRCSECPEEQHRLCLQRRTVSTAEVRNALVELTGDARSARFDGRQVVIDGALTLEQESALTHRLRVRVRASRTIRPVYFRGERMNGD